MKLTRRLSSLTAIAAVAGLALAGCASADTNGTGQGPADGYTEADIEAALQEPAEITYWQWTPGVEKQAELFMAKHPKIKVNVVNVGQGPDQYAKLRTAIKAGTGAPDLAMIEYQFIDSFAVSGSLVDLTPFGVDAYEGDYPEWLWAQVQRPSGVYGFPSNAGPMGTLYRESIFAEAGVEPPETWDDYEAAAAAIRATGNYITTIPGSNPGHMLGLFWQSGAQPFTYDGDRTISVDFDSPEVARVIDKLQDLLDKDLVDNANDFTDSWFQGLANGRYASWMTAAWAPVFLDSGTVANTAGDWRAAPMPQWDAGTTVSSNWGGNGTSVIKGTKNPLVAYAFARFLNHDPEGTHMLAFEQSQFPATTAIADSAEYADQQPEFFGGQEINKVFIDSSKHVDARFQWLPIMDYVFQSYAETLGRSIADGTRLADGLEAWEAEITTFAESQGFTVKK